VSEFVVAAAEAKYVSAGLVHVVTPENLAALDELADAGRRIMLLTSRTEV
jgi:phosphoglycolate phosphatase